MTLGDARANSIHCQDHLLVPEWTTDVGKCPRKTGNDGAAPGGVTAGVRVVSAISDLSGSCVDLTGVPRQAAGTGGHHRHIPIADPLNRGSAQRPW